jgi:hypothetical protein
MREMVGIEETCECRRVDELGVILFATSLRSTIHRTTHTVASKGRQTY